MKRKKLINIIIAGGRNFKPKAKHKNWLGNSIFGNYDGSDLIIFSGNCSGADMFGESFAEEFNIPVKLFPADWNKHGKTAGYIRNKEMADSADVCILFPGGKGTHLMKSLAEKAGLKITEYHD